MEKTEDTRIIKNKPRHKNSIFIILLIITLISINSCTPVNEKNLYDQTKPGITVIFSFNPETYPSFIKKAYPQIAIWVTQKDSKSVHTIYATESGVRNKWWGADKRPESLPVWYGVRSIDSESRIDAVTGATPSGKSFKTRWNIPAELIGKSAEVLIEANISFDYNEHYIEKAKDYDPRFSGVNGQPSLIWKAGLKFSGDMKTVTPEIAGHGHVLGDTHEIYPDLSKITTAKDIFHYIKIIYEPGK